MKSEELPPKTEPFKITMRVEGMGHVPAFKNGKKIVQFYRPGSKGKVPSIITDPKKSLWMDRCISSFLSQLRGLFPTTESGTAGEWRKQSPTASFLPADDSWQWMIPGQQSVLRVPHGCEGAVITIEEIVPE